MGTHAPYSFQTYYSPMADKEGFGVTILKTVEDLARESETMFSEFLSEFVEFGSKRVRSSDSIRVTKTPDLVTIEVDVPGAAREDVKVKSSPGCLRVEWTPKGREKREKVFGIGKRADLDSVTAKVENGVLTLTVKSKAPTPAEERDVSVG